MAETPEERKARLATQLAKGRETAAANRATKAAQPSDPAIVDDGDDEIEFTPRGGIEPSEERVERRLRLLEGIDPAIADLISDAELDDIEAEERQKAEAERKKQALASVRASLRQRARVENDLIAADVLLSDEERRRRQEMVKFRIDLPEGGGASGFRVDGFLYQHGREYTRPRAIAESLHANHYQTWLKETEFVTLNQQKRNGRTARQVLAHTIPRFYVSE